VFEGEMRRFRAAVREGRFELATHAFKELEPDGLTILDLERSVLTGRIVERQRDRTTGEKKYVIEGRAEDGLEVTVVVKWKSPSSMKFLTAFRTYP
jgi:hypothetical protein